MSTVTFMGLKLSQPELIRAVLEPVLRTLVESLTGVKTDYGTAAALPGLNGATKTAQQSRKDLAEGALQQILTGVLLGQQTTAAGSAQLTATKAQLLATEASARAAGFDVLPDGVVRVSHAQRAYCKATWTHGGKKLLRVLTMWAAQYSAQMRGTLAQASTVDAQIATALVKLATDYLTNLFQKDGQKAALPPPTTVPSPQPPATPSPPAANPPIGSGATPQPVGGAAAVGAETVLAGAGAGPLGGAGLPGGATGMHLSGAGPAAAVALAGTAGGGVLGTGVGLASAGAGRVLTGGTPMPMTAAGAHGAGRGEAGAHAAEDWLVEDGESWHPGEAPEGVIT